MAADSAGNVFIADSDNNAVKEWNASTQQVTTLVSGLGQPYGIGVDGSGNVYFVDRANDAVKEWNASTQQVATLVSGLPNAMGLAVDNLGNVYFSNVATDVVEKWNSTTGLTTPISSGVSTPVGLAVDSLGNLYIADAGNNTVKEWNATTGFTTLVSSGLNQPYGVAVDGSGNVYIADTYNNAVKEWHAATNTVTTLVSGLDYPRCGVAVDGSGNVYIANTGASAVMELPRAYVNPTALSEASEAGNDQLPAVMPTTLALTGPLAPTSDQSWLTITGVNNGVVSFSFTANSGSARTAHICLLGKYVAVNQAGPSLGTTALLEGPGSGSDAVLLNAGTAWSANSHAPWLQLSVTSGTGSASVGFSFAANTGAARTGTLTIAGLTLTVTQAGAGYVAANPVTTLVSGMNSLASVAVDGAGNLYFADTNNRAIKEWNAASGMVNTLVSGLIRPEGVAVDSAGNVYFADCRLNVVEEWSATTQTVSTLVSGLDSPCGVAVDSAGNVYIADTDNNAIKEWIPRTGSITTLVSSGLSYPDDVAVDSAGNVYIADSNNNAIKEWSPTTQLVSTLVSGLNEPWGVAVDGEGNVYFADSNNHAVKEWDATSGTVATLFSPGPSSCPSGVAVDASGNVYMADWSNSTIMERLHAFVPGESVSEGAAAGSDQLPAVLPTTLSLTGVLAPSSDQTWLTLGNSAGGVIPFSFSGNTGPTRTAHITVLGQQIAVTQAGIFNPNFTGLSAPTITYGAASTTISGTLDANAGGQLVPSTESVSITLNGVVQSALLDGSDNFRTTFDTHALHVVTPDYTISFSYNGDSNFAATSGSSTLTVDAYAFTYQIPNDNQTYGSPANLAGNLPSTISTGVNGENLGISYSSTGDTATAQVQTGGYAITGSLSSSTGLTTDYNVTLDPGTLTVNPYAFTYQIHNDNQTYGSPANLAGNLPSTISTGVNGENLGISYSSTGDTATAQVRNGGYAITGSLSSSTGLTTDYNVTLDPGTLTVNPYAFTYQIHNDNQTYGSPANLAADFPSTISTGVNGESLGISYQCTGDTATAPVGHFAITGILFNSGGRTTDYNVTLFTGTLTVEKGVALVKFAPGPSRAQAGLAPSSPIGVQMVDGNNKSIAQAGATVCLDVYLDTTLVTTFTATTNAQGLASFANLGLTLTGLYTLKAYLKDIPEPESESYSFLRSASVSETFSILPSPTRRLVLFH